MCFPIKNNSNYFLLLFISMYIYIYFDVLKFEYRSLCSCEIYIYLCINHYYSCIWGSTVDHFIQLKGEFERVALNLIELSIIMIKIILTILKSYHEAQTLILQNYSDCYTIQSRLWVKWNDLLFNSFNVQLQLNDFVTMIWCKFTTLLDFFYWIFMNQWFFFFVTQSILFE